MAHAADRDTPWPGLAALNFYKICLGSRIPPPGIYYRVLVSSNDWWNVLLESTPLVSLVQIRVLLHPSHHSACTVCVAHTGLVSGKRLNQPPGFGWTGSVRVFHFESLS